MASDASARAMARKPMLAYAVAGIAWLVLLMAVAGYSVGRDLAHRDNARAAAKR
jgi:hypothetical protein